MTEQLDLFGDPPTPVRHRAAGGYSARPGSGPAGKTCGDCTEYRTVHGNTRTYPKCNRCRANWTHGKGSDIKRSAPACAMFEPKKPQ